MAKAMGDQALGLDPNREWVMEIGSPIIRPREAFVFDKVKGKMPWE